MSRLHKRLIVVFCLGVLLTGVGAGVMFAEFSALSYGGEYILGEPDMRTDTIDVAFRTEEEALDIVGVRGWYNPGVACITADGSVPENTVRFCVTYNAKRVEPTAYWDREENRIDFSWCWKNGNSDTEIMMEAKDIVLQNLKNGKVVSVNVTDVEEVTVLVNPKSEESLRLAD